MDLNKRVFKGTLRKDFAREHHMLDDTPDLKVCGLTTLQPANMYGFDISATPDPQAPMQTIISGPSEH